MSGLATRIRTDGKTEIFFKGQWLVMGSPDVVPEMLQPIAAADDDPPRLKQKRTGTDKRRRTLIYRAFWRHTETAKLTGREQAIWCYLWRLADAKTLCCWPSIGRIARRTGAGRVTVRRSLARLKAAGFIVQKAGPCNLGRTNKSPVYMLTIPSAK